MTATSEIEERKTPNEWQEIDGVIVYDPDGWDRSNYKEDWARPITRDEWNKKMAASTCSIRPEIRAQYGW